MNFLYINVAIIRLKSAIIDVIHYRLELQVETSYGDSAFNEGPRTFSVARLRSNNWLLVHGKRSTENLAAVVNSREFVTVLFSFLVHGLAVIFDLDFFVRC